MNPYKILDLIVKRYLNILDKNLVGIYLHGSLAMGCFTEQSDIDFLVVVEQPLAFEIKRALINELLKLQDLPKKGIEMSVILKKYAQHFEYPTPFELHYSDAHKDKYLNDRNYVCGDYVDYDLAAHMFIIKHRGLCLYGKEISNVFADFPEKYYIDSILRDVQHAEEEIIQNPVYCTLNLCRVLYYLRCRKISSKLEGGLWGIENLPAKYAKLLRLATSTYQNKPVKEYWNHDDLIDFAQYML